MIAYFDVQILYLLLRYFSSYKHAIFPIMDEL